MKIEKINDNQIKLILTQADLLERDLKLEDLASQSEKTQALFHDLMEQAMEKCDFVLENTPLMVEALPLGQDSLMLIVTKLETKPGEENQFKMLTQSKEMRRYKRKALELPQTQETVPGEILIYSFETLDDVIHLSQQISPSYQGNSALYKNENAYYLLLQPQTATTTGIKTEELDYILGEYGKKHISTTLAQYFLVEHGEILVENRALTVLSKSFGDA